jgi:hypothetical protein
VHRKEDLLLGPIPIRDSDPDPASVLSDSGSDAVVDAVFSKPICKPDLGIQKKNVASCTPSPEAQALIDTVAGDYAYLADRRRDVALDDRLKVFYALTFIRARGNRRGLYRRYTEGADALHGYEEVTNTPRLAALFDSVLDRDRVIEPNDFRKGHDAANGGVHYQDAVPF